MDEAGVVLVVIAGAVTEKLHTYAAIATGNASKMKIEMIKEGRKEGRRKEL